MRSHLWPHNEDGEASLFAKAVMLPGCVSVDPQLAGLVSLCVNKCRSDTVGGRGLLVIRKATSFLELQMGKTSVQILLANLVSLNPDTLADSFGLR